MHSATLPFSRQERKINKTGLGEGVFLLYGLFYHIDQQNTSINFHAVFVSLILFSCMKLVTNKWQTSPCKVLKKFSVGCGDYLVISVLHETFVSYGYFFKIDIAVAQINWAVLQTKLKLSLIQCYIFYKNIRMWYRMGRYRNLMRYSLSSWI